MKTEVTLVFPHQLFDPNPILSPDRPVWLVEDGLFFGGDPHQPIKFHRHKLVLHRAGMKAYAARLIKQGFQVNYVEHQPGKTIEEILPSSLTHIWLNDPVDYLLERRLRRNTNHNNVTLHIADTPMFLTSPDWFNPWFDSRKRYHMADFYIAQRKRMNVLVDGRGKPVGGKWSFDADNRKKWPDKKNPPPVFTPSPSPWVKEAKTYVDKNFPTNPGDAASFWYPVTHEEARNALHHFLAHRFLGFGDFEDAISTRHGVLHHSVLTPSLNCGLITPREIVDQTLAFAADHHIPMNDLEGFLRQIIGWREFMRIVYVREGVRQRTGNFWEHRRKLDDRWYRGTTGLPVDQVIRRVMDTSYANHIERLMVLGNAMLLCEIDPDEIYRWFMECFIDAYDWVMVPNVYGMSQYADGGLITTKPYFSGSNYLRKMSDYSAGPWCEIWDGLFWRFIDKHRAFYEKQPRLSMMVRTLDKMDEKKKTHLLKTAANFLIRNSGVGPRVFQ